VRQCYAIERTRLSKAEALEPGTLTGSNTVDLNELACFVKKMLTFSKAAA
jgi:hypothetical protein